MDEFRTIAKLWPSGTELNLGTDSNLLGGPATFTRNTPNFVTPDGVHNYQFLFWNTGRHVTNKRRVRWNFSVLGWGTWTATRWYGTPGSGPGAKRVRADAFTIGNDMVLSPTPIDSAASTFAAGAYPFSGDDHAIGTAGGPVNVIAKDPYDSYDFAGWTQLIWGGDDSGDFVETDAGSGGTIGGVDFYDHVVGGSFPVAKDGAADLLATYGYQTKSSPWTPALLEEALQTLSHLPVNPADNNPMDRLRLDILSQILAQTRPGSTGANDFQKLIEAAPNMNADQLHRAAQSIKMSLELGKTALTSIEARMKAKNK